MSSSQLFYEFRRLAFVALFVCLCSCGSSLFSPDTRQIAGGYRLKRAGNPSQFSLIAPYESGGLIIDEIAWRKPIILARASGSDYWDVINTERAQHIRVSETDRKSDVVYQSIEITPIDIAWMELRPNKRLW